MIVTVGNLFLHDIREFLEDSYFMIVQNILLHIITTTIRSQFEFLDVKILQIYQPNFTKNHMNFTPRSNM